VSGKLTEVPLQPHLSRASEKLTRINFFRAPALLRRYRTRFDTPNQILQNEALGRAEAELIRISLRRFIEDRVNGSIPTDQVRMTIEDRREYVANALMTKVCFWIVMYALYK
jgi:hypothetical protein